MVGKQIKPIYFSEKKIMAYRYDPDLEFLKNCDNDDLKILVDYLTTSKDGGNRLTEELTITKEYKKYYPNNLKELYPKFAEELQRYGGDTIVNFFRNGGVSYRTILEDVANKSKVNFNKSNSTEQIEEYLIQKIVSDSISKMSDEELKQFIEEFGGGKVVGVGGSLTTTAYAALRYAIQGSGFKLYKLSAVIANNVAKNLLGRGLSFAANAAVSRAVHVGLMFLGPIMWAITAIWTIKDITSLAFRVTTPCVIHIAYMRLKYKNKDSIES
ncbi:DUF3944 domain-containing protein [Riemerella anatipestifer]|uniref:DUF3944 domain-containing protein n=1 Tax=Riemerella anatipestifer TaxID=34085 RepID=UPI002265C2ED|nr:DUF3944 domain-containing protein [Riemerella anatipestifer]UZX28544.1 DUF3944 domain-containing protein [Riemerella anatipestifer]